MARYTDKRMLTLTPQLKRLSRPDNPPPFRITDRDLEILRTVARYRFMTSEQIARYLIMLDPATTGARGGAAVLLGLLNPFAAILPFIEIGDGKNSNCGKLISEAKEPDPDATSPGKEPPLSKDKKDAAKENTEGGKTALPAPDNKKGRQMDVKQSD